MSPLTASALPPQRSSSQGRAMGPALDAVLRLVVAAMDMPLLLSC